MRSVLVLKTATLCVDRIFTDIVSDDLQEVMDNCTLKHASIEHIQRVFRNLYKYAIANDIVKKDYSAFIEIIQEDDDEHGIENRH